MDKQKAKILLDLLKSPSSEKVIKGLHETKKRLLINSENLNVFRTLGLVPQTLKLIQRPNEDILNGALSILSGCCATEAARSEVYNVGGVNHLVNVLKCAKSEALQQRACRTVANQALHRPSCDIFFKLDAVKLVIEMLINCKEDETKLTAIRALRLLASSGEHCQKIVMSKGILHICSIGLGSDANPSSAGLLRSTVKAIAHFSRVSHPACVSQIMEGTDNMMSVSKMSDSLDFEIYECVLRTILNIVLTCFESTTHKRNALDAKVLDRLCTARAPTIIVSELQNRRVTDIEEEKLIIALCKFCEGTNECNNLTFGSFSEPLTFLGRAWFQLTKCGGVAMLVSLLITHRHNIKLRPTILKAILGVEHNYSFRDTVLKHLLAANILPQLAEQFDELMAEYRQVRRDSQPGSCVHTIKTSSDKLVELQGVSEGEKEESEDTGGQDKRRNQMGLKENQVHSAEQNEIDGSISRENIREINSTSKKVLKIPSDTAVPMETSTSNEAFHTSEMLTADIENLSHYPSSEKGTKIHGISKESGLQMETLQQKSLPSHSLGKDTLFVASQESLTLSSSRSPRMYIYSNPASPGSVSCSPRSIPADSGSSPGSSSWSPAQSRSESPTFSPPFVSHPHSNAVSIVPKALDFTALSNPISPDPSPPHSPIMQSPPRSTSPIRVPSDWEYDDEDEMEHSDDGRFSPIVHDSKWNDSDGNKDEIDELEEESAVNNGEEICEDGLQSKKMPDATDSLTDNTSLNEDQAVTKNIDEKLVLSPTLGKRLRDSSDITCLTIDIPQEKKIKSVLQTPDNSESQEEEQSTLIGGTDMMTEEVRSTRPLVSSEIKPEKEGFTGVDTGKSPFVKLNQIKFRVRKKGYVKRQTSTTIGETKTDVYSPIKELQKNQLEQQPKHEQQQITRVQKSSKTCLTAGHSDLNTEEVQSLELLELVVRVISLIAHVKEAIKPVCQEFVPRIMTYLSSAQVIHKSATRMLVTIARNPLCIQPLLDSLFIPYVGVELGEAGDPESPNGCSQCRILSEGAMAFLEEIVKFFNHIHQYGKCEVTNRLHPTREHSVREGCVMALPHITRCPKLLHDFMVCYSALDLLMTVFHSERPPNDANYMYATAALSKLATTLQLDNQYKPVMCTMCLHRGKHTPEEVAENIKIQQKREKKLNCKQDSTVGPFSDPLDPSDVKVKECKWKDDETKDVTFKLDDGSTVSANREFLAEKNEVLRGMLMGSFAEGVSTFVELPLTSKTSLEMLIHFLYGCRCDLMEKGDVKAYIDLVFFSQMYMVENLHSYAVFKMMSSINDGGDIIRIYESGVGRIDENLILQALCVVLVKPMKTWKRALWIKELFESKHAEDINHNIRMIIYHPLDMNRLICNCDQSLSLYMVNESAYRKLCL
ncbi:uncharacterized protein [Panulirus ornatus]|uniref:uncharacterized protein n=1 Tax=Panulirus ornatus TaxID=150431 RepID=UPI003A83B094